MTSAFRVVPVIDVKGGITVHAVAGDRDRYAPLQSEICQNCDPGHVAWALHEAFGFECVYVADLDAIEGRDRNAGAYHRIAKSGMRIWLDAGVESASGIAELADQAIERIVVGLESLRSMQDLSEILAVWGPRPIVFSLDLNNGVPLARERRLQKASPLSIAREAIYRGVEQMIVLDLADVGTKRGSRIGELCRSINKRAPAIEITAGGGVRSANDLQELARYGCRGALVATALHRRAITRRDLALSALSTCRTG